MNENREFKADSKISNDRIILIDIDCLLDTRLGLVSTYSQETALRIALDVNYRTRDSDTEYFSKYIEDWEEKWKQRGNIHTEKLEPKVIKASGPTPFANVIFEYLRDEANEIYRPFDMSSFKIVINTYPYMFTSEEDMILKEVISEIFPIVSSDNISIVRIKPIKLTPAIIKKQYDCYFLYDLPEWMSTHKKEFEYKLHPGTVIYAPKLKYYPKEINLSKEEKEYVDSEDFFKNISGLLSIWLDLRHLDVYNYCLVLPTEK